VCVVSNLGPAGCFFGSPSKPEEFANQCSTAACEAFDNCDRLGLCKPSDLVPDPIQPPVIPPPDASPIDAPPPPQLVDCFAPGRPVIVVGGSTAVQPFLSVVAPLLTRNPTVYQIVYQPSGSCAGVDGLFSTDPSKHIIKDIPGRPALLFHTDGTFEQCTLGSGAPLDVAASDVFASSCNPTYQVSDAIAEYPGPIQPMTFVVKATSSERAISAEMAHVVFGRGNTDPTSKPYDDPALYFVRNSGSGTQQMISRAIEIDAKRWWGIDRGGSTAVRDQLEAVNPARASSAIGILSTDFADAERQRLRIVAFKARGQTCAYFPDSTVNTRDKLNVRDGHYAIWGPVHFFAPVTANLPGAAAGALVTLFTQSRLDKTLLDAVIKSGLIPSCAMKVRRETEMGPILADAQPFQCGCYFEATVPDGQAPASCRPCAGPTECPSDRPACNLGFCEQQP
jgi:ABC-type phosphate transport system substrate-binding protein